MSQATLDMSSTPELARIVELVSAGNPLQRKRIHAFLDRQLPDYWSFAEDLSRTLNRSILQTEADRAAAARSYNQTCMDILREQIRFRKTGTYLLDNAGAAADAVYHNEPVMRYYIVGLLLSYLFWPNHYEMFQFYREQLASLHVTRCLEVGAGHGLFTAEFLRRFPQATLTLVDISETSIALARDMLAAFGVAPSRVQFIHDDYFKAALPAHAFDFVIMGEVLEHVDNAPAFMSRTRDLLSPGGKIFVSTCANCPAVDHVYHFHNVGEIRDLFARAGLDVLRDLVLAAESVPEERWQEELVTINYCGVLCAAKDTYGI